MNKKILGLGLLVFLFSIALVSAHWYCGSDSPDIEISVLDYNPIQGYQVEVSAVKCGGITRAYFCEGDDFVCCPNGYDSATGECGVPQTCDIFNYATYSYVTSGFETLDSYPGCSGFATKATQTKWVSSLEGGWAVSSLYGQFYEAPVYMEYPDYDIDEEEICDDEIDNDGDGDIDCEDDDCDGEDVCEDDPVDDECCVDEDCGDGYVTAPYCSDEGDVVIRGSSFSCVEGLCFEDVVTDVVSECEFGCSEGACLDEPIDPEEDFDLFIDGFYNEELFDDESASVRFHTHEVPVVGIGSVEVEIYLNDVLMDGFVSLPFGSEDRDWGIGFGRLDAGDYNLKIVVDPSDNYEELDEDNDFEYSFEVLEAEEEEEEDDDDRDRKKKKKVEEDDSVIVWGGGGSEVVPVVISLNENFVAGEEDSYGVWWVFLVIGILFLLLMIFILVRLR